MFIRKEVIEQQIVEQKQINEKIKGILKEAMPQSESNTLSSTPTKKPPQSTLDWLRKHSKVVADTGDFRTNIEQFQPVDVTTNPALILAAVKNNAQTPEYAELIKEAVNYAKNNISKKTEENTNSPEDIRTLATEKLFVLVGKRFIKEHLGHSPGGRVSTQLDARLAFDRDAMIQKALHFIALYEEEGVPRERVLIKVPATWEGIEAGRTLESEHGVHCNMTLVFSRWQAIACAQAGATLVSPYVGRVTDWHIAKTMLNNDPKTTTTITYDRNTDPGVLNVREIYAHFKQHRYRTQLMAASFRNTEQIKGLIGCDLLTICPALLSQLAEDREQFLEPGILSLSDQFEKKCVSSEGRPKAEEDVLLDEKAFRFAMNEDAMATEKLAEGIRRFAADARALEQIIDANL